MGSTSASTEESGGAESSGIRAGDDDFVLVGLVTRPHGVRGSVKVEIWSDVPDRFKPGRKLFLAADGHSSRQQSPRPVRIAHSQPARGGAIVHFERFETREQAEDIRGHRLQIPRSEVPDAPTGLYYHFDLIGCRCVDAELGELGEVREILEDGGGELLEITRPERTLLVPFVEAFLESVNIADKEILLRLPPGLVETCESKS